MGIIDYEKLEEPMREIEEILKKHDIEEQHLILRQINERYKQQKQKQKMNDMVSQSKAWQMARKFMGKDGDNDESSLER